MAAPAGNDFWKLRSKHGREMLFSSPTILWEACCEYFEQTSKRVWSEKHWVGKDANEVTKDTAVPFLISGLCIFLDIDRQTWKNYGTKEEYKDFFAITKKVNEIIYTQKFEGAAVGAFNPVIIARDLGLTERTDVTSKGDALPSIPVVTWTKPADDGDTASS